MNEIRVKVTRHAGRKYLVMYYDDPMTGRRHQRSTKQTRRREAERESAKWEADLRSGRYKPGGNISWEEFRLRYEEEVLPSLAVKTDIMAGTVFNSVERMWLVAIGLAAR